MLINYNSFAVSVICFPLLYLGTYYSIVSARVGTYINSATNKPLTDSEQTQYQMEYLLRNFLFLVVFLIHHYLNLLDVSRMVIEKHMLSRSQSQLFEFINQNNEPILVLEREGTGFSVLLSNQQADKMLLINNKTDKQNRLSQKIIQLMTRESIDEIGIHDSGSNSKIKQTEEYISIEQLLKDDLNQVGTGIQDLVVKVMSPSPGSDFDFENPATLEKENIVQFSI